MRTWRDVRGLSPVAMCETLSALAAAVPAGSAVVELGVFRGRSVCALGEGAALAGARVWGFDPWDLPGERGPYRSNPSKRVRRNRQSFTATATRRAAAYNVTACGLDDVVTLVRAFSIPAAALWDDGPPVALLHVDGDHSAAARDIAAWWPHLADDCVIAVDDYQPKFQAVMRDIDTLAAVGMVTPPTVHHGRLAVVRRAGGTR